MGKEEVPKASTSMADTPEHKRSQDITLPLPNREIRRKFKKLQHKKHFKEELARRGVQLPNSTPKSEEAQKMVDEETKAELLKNLDVQEFLKVLNGVLTGQKRVVIESQPRGDGTGLIKHTFRVEDVDAPSE